MLRALLEAAFVTIVIAWVLAKLGRWLDTLRSSRGILKWAARTVRMNVLLVR
jgi:hypothetical protein